MNRLNVVAEAGQLQFEGHAFPSVVQCDVSDKLDLAGWVKANKNFIEAALQRSGAVLFRGFPVNSAETFDQFSAAFGYPDFTYAESLSNAVRLNFTERVFTANEAPPEVEIFLHHEMAQTPISPSKLFFYCHSAAEVGGATPLCRSDQLFQKLYQTHPVWADEFESKGLKYTTLMPSENDLGSGQGRSWKSTLSVEDESAAEVKLRSLGYSWKWMDDNGLEATTPRLPAVVELETGEKAFYNQLIAAYQGWKGVKENPKSAICFGDGSDIAVEKLDYVASLAEEFTFDLLWQDGDVALVDNYRTMHGRRSYAGTRKRQVLVALAGGSF
ncbi:MAG: hypothetical protein ACJAVI_000731 [Candidatus Azotimanducaceae bacterium]